MSVVNRIVKFVLCLVIVCQLANGAEVKWEVFDIENSGGGIFQGEELYYLRPREGVAQRSFIDVLVVDGDDLTNISSGREYLMTCCTWVLANYGDVLTDKYFTDANGVFFNYGIRGSDYSSTCSLNLAKGDSAYLAVLFATTEDNYANFGYGWVQLMLGIDGELGIVSSALGIDGNPLVVGEGGQGDVIPEPSCVLLLLLGLGVFGLCRKRMGV